MVGMERKIVVDDGQWLMNWKAFFNSKVSIYAIFLCMQIFVFGA